MKKKIGLSLLIAIFTLVGISRPAMASLSIIPMPEEMTENPGQFAISKETVIAVDSDAAEVRTNAAYLSQLLTGSLGSAPAVKRITGSPADGAILLTTAHADAALSDEGYELTATPQSLTIRARTSAGLFYGVQTLRQLLPAGIKPGGGTAQVVNVPCVVIKDSPRIAWRGFMLDVSRHFFDKMEVKAVLDQMAQLKLNVFHWHLTDDHGWRIEIKKYPKLTSVGAWREATDLEKGSSHIVDGRYGGFYTQDDIREVVAYASARHIRIVPEVDMPGHMSAAAAAYPELSPANGWTPMLARQVKGSGERCAALCIGREKTLQFCKDVLAELLPLFPSKEIHIGGDEVFYEQWEPCPDMQALKAKLAAKDWEEVQVWFENQISAYLAEQGRTAIIWNNIYRQTVDERAINQFWRAPMNHARDFANASYGVLISDSNYYYFDHHPALEKAYLNDPLNIPGLSAEGKSHVLGLVSCAWTERIPTFGKLQGAIYPLLIAHAESAWTPQDRKDWASFQARLAQFKFAGN